MLRLSEQVSVCFDFAGEAWNALTVSVEGGGSAARIPLSACGGRPHCHV